ATQRKVRQELIYVVVCLARFWTNCLRNNQSVASEETTMGTTGAVFQPELITLMKDVLDDAVATLPESKRTSTMKAEMASHILACAAKGERNPAALRIRSEEHTSELQS